MRQIAVPEAVPDEAAAQFLINPTTGAQPLLKPASQLSQHVPVKSLVGRCPDLVEELLLYAGQSM